ncbi:MAG: TlyA family RNA methyltransferase [Clostridiales Family XIII bacterium]|jgi:23S rRNA (cytidine1920-2'-O)/16S rRNA (cytidine1409-2'-O)-methyltransferase|nr:TlyA family RNA methyltransferase [Clostridiales Family XIII bacterium]
MKQIKDRLDIILYERGYFTSREKAKAAVMAGIVEVDGERVLKAGVMVSPLADINVKGPVCPYVSRGGLKLAGALDAFGLSVEAKIAVDIGASTGGFTDCMLQRGASRVYSIDVGYGQLDWKLRTDPRVVNMERVNIRLMDPGVVPEKAAIVTVDVSFISLKLVLPTAESLLSLDGHMICLVKPQFEAGRRQVGKKGIVRDSRVHKEVIHNVMGYARENGLAARALIPSPVRGAKGNIEFLMLLSRLNPDADEEPDLDADIFDIDAVVNTELSLNHKQ